jgi:hypothetical protein
MKFLPNYWRAASDASGDVTIDTVFHACTGTACSTTANGTVLCDAHHLGPVCSQCEDGFIYSSKNGGCSACPNKTVSKGLLALVTLIGFLGTVFMIRRAGSKRSRTVSIVRVFLNYVQANSSMGSFTSRAPVLIRDMLGVAAVADGAFDSTLVQCVARLSYFDQVLIYFFIPIMAAVVASIYSYFQYLIRRCLSCLFKCCRRPQENDVLASLTLARTTAMIITFFFFNKVTWAVMSVYALNPLSIENQTVLKFDLTVTALSRDHVILMAVSLSVLILPPGA